MSLAQRSLSAARWTTVSTIIRTAIQLLQLIVLTRFLSPKDYGLISIVMVIISYAALFSDMGLSTAFVQRQQVNNEERSSLFWLNIIIGTCLMLLTIAASPLAAYLLNESELTGLISLVATNFLVAALSQQLRMDAEKALNFRPVALIEIAAAFSGFAVAVIMAWMNWGVYSLVASNITSAWIGTILSWVLLAQGWRPMWRLRWEEVHWFIKFGGGMVLNNVINHVNTTADLLLGGRLLGAAQLGLYSVPRNLILQIQFMVNPIFTRIGFPVISSIQDDLTRVKHAYLKIMNLTASINAPIYASIAFFSDELVQLLLGQEFHKAAPLMETLAIWGLFRSFANPVGSLLFGLGKIYLSTIWNLAILVIMPLAIWYGSQYGARGMALSMTGVMVVLFIPCWVFLIRPTCGAGFWTYSRQVINPTLTAILAGTTAWLLVNSISIVLLRLSLGLAIGLIVYVTLSFIINPDATKIIMNLRIKNRLN